MALEKEGNGRNNYRSKFRRGVAALVLPVDETREGKCKNCGECCKLPHACFFLGYMENGSSYCRIYKTRPPSCRKYPRTTEEHLTAGTCGYSFRKKED